MMRWMALKNCCYLLLLIVIWMGNAYAAEKPYNIKPFYAEQYQSVRDMPDKVVKTKIYMSKLGVRQETQAQPGDIQSKLIIIHLTQDETTWFIVPSRKFYVVPSELEEVEADEEGEDDVGGVLSMEPCDGYAKKEMIGTGVFSGRAIQKWRCRGNDDAIKTLQYYDTGLNMVIRDAHDSGVVEELRNIKPGRQPKKLFEIPKGYRKATMSEFVTGVREFPSYQEAPAAPFIAPE